MDVRILGWAANHSGCGQYRIGVPMWALSRAGHDAVAFSALNTELPEDLDVLVGQVVHTPDRAEYWQSLARMPGRRFALVYEIDDDLWNTHRSNQGANTFLDPQVRQEVEANIAVSDAVTVTTATLAERVSAFNPNVHVVPNCIDEAVLHHARPQRDRLTVGWAGGSSHNQDFAAVRGELRSFLRRSPHVDMHFIGTDYRAAVGRPDARFTGWSANLVEYLHNLDFDIGIAPLAYHVFNKSKSDLKVLEYAALGIPVVATDYGPYSESVQHGVTGLLVRRPFEWARYLRDLVNDDAMRTEMGENARRWAATRTVQGNLWRWETAYRSAIESIPAAEARPAVSSARQPTTPVRLSPPRSRTPRPEGVDKVFVIGHNKTGTTSMEAALTSLGFRMGDQARGELLLDDWSRGRYDDLIALCHTAEAFQDIPFSLWDTYKVLDTAFPDAKFILTVRPSSDDWYRSVLAWGRQLTNARGDVPTAAEMRAFHWRRPGYFLHAHQLTYGVTPGRVYDRDQYIACYEKHNRDVAEYFRGRPGALLTLDVSTDDAIARLHRFLGVADAAEAGPMPWLNRTTSEASMARLVEAARA